MSARAIWSELAAVRAGDDAAEDLPREDGDQQSQEPSGQAHEEDGGEVAPAAREGQAREVGHRERPLGQGRVEHVGVAAQGLGHGGVDRGAGARRRIDQHVAAGRGGEQGHGAADLGIVRGGLEGHEGAVVAAPPVVAQDDPAGADARGVADLGQEIPLLARGLAFRAVADLDPLALTHQPAGGEQGMGIPG